MTAGTSSSKDTMEHTEFWTIATKREGVYTPSPESPGGSAQEEERVSL